MTDTHPAPFLVFERKTRFIREPFGSIEPKGSEWLVKHFLPAHGVGILAGPSTVGKSFVVLYFALRIALGKDVLNHRTRKSGVLYVASEGQDGMRKRVKALRQKFNMNPGTAFELICQAPDLLDEDDMGDLAAVACEVSEDMQANCGAPLGLIVIDTTAASMPGGNENAGEDMSRALANARMLSDKTGALVLLVGHTGKNEQLGVRGWSGQIGNSDVIIYLTSDEMDAKLRHGRVFKLKDGEGGEQFAYRLKPISMGYDADGDEITSAYPSFEEPMAGSAGKKPVKLKPGQQLVMRALHCMIEDGQARRVPSFEGVPPGTLGVERSALRDKAACMGYASPDDKADTIRRNFNRDVQAMAAANVVRVEGELVWPIRR